MLAQETDPSLQKHARRKRGVLRPPLRWRTCQGLIRPVMHRHPAEKMNHLFTAVLRLSLDSISQKAPPVTTSTSYVPSSVHANSHGPGSGTGLYWGDSRLNITHCWELHGQSVLQLPHSRLGLVLAANTTYPQLGLHRYRCPLLENQRNAINDEEAHASADNESTSGSRIKQSNASKVNTKGFGSATQLKMPQTIHEPSDFTFEAGSSGTRQALRELRFARSCRGRLGGVYSM